MRDRDADDMELEEDDGPRAGLVDDSQVMQIWVPIDIGPISAKQ